MTDGAALRDWVLLVAGNIFMLLLAARAVGHFAKREWGEMIGMGVAAVFVAGFVYFPDQSIGFFQDIWQTFLGESGGDDSGEDA